MSETDVTAAAREYMALIADDHHKDRDCHWAIEERWSYGEGSTYWVTHDGYLWPADGTGVELGPFAQREEGVAALEREIRKAIGAVR